MPSAAKAKFIVTANLRKVAMTRPMSHNTRPGMASRHFRSGPPHRAGGHSGRPPCRHRNGFRTLFATPQIKGQGCALRGSPTGSQIQLDIANISDPYRLRSASLARSSRTLSRCGYVSTHINGIYIADLLAMRGKEAHTLAAIATSHPPIPQLVNVA
jgi:hypothetical protein